MYLGIDIGGTKTLIGLFDGNGSLKQKLKFDTPENYQDFLTKLQDKLHNFELKHVKSCCVAVPGKIDRESGRTIGFGNLDWGQIAIKSDIEKIVGRHTYIENDANLAGFYEASKLEHDKSKVLYITISTGIGSGLITNGIIDPGFADAEVGQIILEHDNKLQRWEEFASGKAITKMFGKQASEITDKASWYLISRNIALGLIDLITTLTPEVIIIGGGVGLHLMKFKDRLDEELQIFKNDLIEIPPIIQASEPENAVIYGCYLYAKRTK